MLNSRDKSSKRILTNRPNRGRAISERAEEPRIEIVEQINRQYLLNIVGFLKKAEVLSSRISTKRKKTRKGSLCGKSKEVREENGETN